MGSDVTAAAGPTRSARAARIATGQGALFALVVGHAGVAVLGWGRATAWGGRRPDIVSLGFGALMTLLALAVAVASIEFRTSRWRAAVVCGALLLVPVQLYLQARFDASLYRFETSLTGGPYRSDDGALSVNVLLCDPFRPHRFAVLDVTRLADRRRWQLLLPLERGVNDAYQFGPWARLTALGHDRYWVVVPVAIARPGPQHYLLQMDRDPPRLTTVNRGLTTADGRAEWDCAVWGTRPGADPVADFAGPSGLLPPERACRLAGLAKDCGPGIVDAALRRPEWAPLVPGLPACLAGRSGLGDLAAWDARIALALEARDIALAGSIVEAAAAADEERGDACAEQRRAARLVAVGRRLNRYDYLLSGGERLLAARAAKSECTAAGPAATEIARPSVETEWEVASVYRRWGNVVQACRRVREMAQRNALPALGAEARAEAERWLAACAAAGPDRP